MEKIEVLGIETEITTEITETLGTEIETTEMEKTEVSGIEIEIMTETIETLEIGTEMTEITETLEIREKKL